MANSKRAAHSRYQTVVDLALRYKFKSVLDIGCRDCVLRDALYAESETAGIAYTGVDIVQNETNTVDYVGDAAQGLPFESGAYELVAGLDVLEHIDDFQKALNEFERLASRCVIVALPNMAHVLFRGRFLLYGRLNSKYDLKYGYGLDRHRWLMVLPQTNRYFEALCAERGFQLERSHLSLGGRFLPKIERVLKWLRFPESWYVFTVVYIMSKPQTEPTSG